MHWLHSITTAHCFSLRRLPPPSGHMHRGSALDICAAATFLPCESTRLFVEPSCWKGCAGGRRMHTPEAAPAFQTATRHNVSRFLLL